MLNLRLKLFTKRKVEKKSVGKSSPKKAHETSSRKKPKNDSKMVQKILKFV